jgi:hypothetical protein
MQWNKRRIKGIQWNIGSLSGDTERERKRAHPISDMNWTTDTTKHLYNDCFTCTQDNKQYQSYHIYRTTIIIVRHTYVITNNINNSITTVYINTITTK